MPISALGEKMLHHRGWLQNRTSPTLDSRLERTFCSGSGEDNKALTGSRPGVAQLLPSPAGRGQGTSSALPQMPRASPLVASHGRGEMNKSHFLKPGTNLLPGKAPARSRGWTRVPGRADPGRTRRTQAEPGGPGLLLPSRTRGGQILIY